MHRVPRFDDRFVGRDQAVTQLSEALSAGRLVTVTGTAGIGKTRLAAELAWVRARRGGTGTVGWCALGGCVDPDDLCDVVADALGLPETLLAGTNTPSACIASWLSKRGLALLVFDECERLSDASVEVLQGWSAAAADTALLVTSRVALGLPGERLFEVAPLTPDASAWLFRIRAPGRRADPRPLSEHDGLVDTLVAQLDGIPLALELAARRLEVLPLGELTRRLEQPLRLLRDPGARPGARHGGLERAIAGSWELLDPAGRAALAQTSVFVDGMPLDGAEAVLRLPGDTEVLDAVHELVRQSLLRPDPAAHPDDPPRYRLFDCIRVFAEAALARAGEAEVTRARHASWFADRASTWYADKDGPLATSARRRLLVERANLLAVVDRGQGSDVSAADAAVRALVGAYLVVWGRRSADWLRRTIDATLEAARCATPPDAPGPANTSDFGQLVLHRAKMLRQAGHYRETDADAARALSLAQSLGDLELEGRAVGTRVIALLQEGDLQSAVEQIERQAEIAERLGDTRMRAMALHLLGEARRPDSVAGLESLLTVRRQALAAFEEVGDRRYGGLARLGVCDTLTALGRDDDARAAASQVLVSSTELDSSWEQVLARLRLAVLDHLAGELDAAVAQLDQARALALASELPELDAEVLVHRVLVDIERVGLGGAALWAADLRGVRGTDWTSELVEVLVCLSTDAPVQAPPEGASPAVRALAEALAERPLDPEALARCLEQLTLPSTGRPRVLARVVEALRAHMVAERTAWEFAEDGTWFRPPGGEQVDLGRRRSAAAILAVLVRQRMACPGVPVPMDDLIAAGWPGERLVPASAKNRCYVALSTLRKLGLGTLQRDKQGYRLEPDIPQRVVALEGAPGVSSPHGGGSDIL